ncbi:OmpA/MotB family protein [Desulforhabdus amnigena]|jgi:chemotaxis protein MotB|uniref:Flagellar motor protein MotB n=1 Tax=Desulforhabdus amnigena TaxID=40218 RepID=A0A9W6FTC7_9BACT|nr:flagellar motor protein MotB [Desulforhabdus amnigena]NLJ27631.1 OmpA family protein [Deltaproteobacteria bacterium]GLI33560.1 flagellar motor protein MotB [Desulforhabdus amnigena]
MARKKKQEESSPGASWLTTFADLTTLLLTFFVLLLSMSTIDETRQRKALDSLVGAFGFLSGGRSAIGKEKGSDPREFTSPINKSEGVDIEMLKEITMQNNVDADIQVLQENDRIIIRISEKILFFPQSAEICPGIKDYLIRLASYLKSTKREIEIQGHTDIHEILKNGIYKDHIQERSWYLSSKRAQVIYTFFGQAGVPEEQMIANGFSYYYPIVKSEQQVEMGSRNQRVDIIVGKDEIIPEALLEVRSVPAKGFSYKNFFFQVFPAEKNETKENF